VLRFVRPEDEQVRYRVLCLSRNLTFDRCWDTMLTLEGDLRDRSNAISESVPLADFVGTLPGLAVRAVGAETKKAVQRMAEELRVVKFEPPEGFDELRFHPMGIEGYKRWPRGGALIDKRIDRLLVVSPFIAKGQLEHLAEPGRGDVLVSRIDQLQAIDKGTLGAFGELLTLHDHAEPEEEESDGERPSERRVPPAGLHAKLYVAEQGWNAHVFTGSSNATVAAFAENVEFLVELVGKKSFCGIDVTLDGAKERGGERGSGLRMLLQTFTPPDQPTVPTETELRLDELLDVARSALSAIDWRAVVGPPDGDRFPFSLEGSCASLPEGVEARVRPITLKEDRALRLTPSAQATPTFGPCSFEALTSFMAFHLRVTVGGVTLEEAFVLNVRLEGAPLDRPARILQSLLDEPGKVLRFLQVLLAEDPMEVAGAHEPGTPTGDALTAGTAGVELALLESLLRALDRDPNRIDAVDALFRDLSSTEAGRRVLPPQLEAILRPIREARATLLQRSRP
jgi:hypothetical protein